MKERQEKRQKKGDTGREREKIERGIQKIYPFLQKPYIACVEQVIINEKYAIQTNANMLKTRILRTFFVRHKNASFN